MRIHFHGNCQLPALRALFAEARPGWSLTSCEVHTPAALAAEAELDEVARAADVIVAQPIRRHYRGADFLSLERLAAAARPGCRVLRVPSMYMDGQLPGWGYLGGGARLRGHRMAYHFYPVAAMTHAGLPAAEIVARVLEPDFLLEPFVRSGAEAALDALRQREGQMAADVTVSDIYAARIRREQLGHTVNHPSRAVLAEVANRLLALLGEPPSVGAEGPEPLPYPHIPLLPATARHLGFGTGRESFGVGAKPRGQPDYFGKLVLHYRSLEDGVLGASLAATREARAWLAAYAATHDAAAWTQPPACEARA